MVIIQLPMRELSCTKQSCSTCGIYIPSSCDLNVACSFIWNTLSRLDSQQWAAVMTSKRIFVLCSAAWVMIHKLSRRHARRADPTFLLQQQLQLPAVLPLPACATVQEPLPPVSASLCTQHFIHTFIHSYIHPYIHALGRSCMNHSISIHGGVGPVNTVHSSIHPFIHPSNHPSIYSAHVFSKGTCSPEKLTAQGPYGAVGILPTLCVHMM